MYLTSIRHASISTGKSLLGKGKPTLSLEQFLQRQKVIALWRDIVRATNKIPMEETRTEMRDFARYEFERFRHVDDIGHIRYLVSTGKTQLDSMSRYVEQNAL